MYKTGDTVKIKSGDFQGIVGEIEPYHNSTHLFAVVAYNGIRYLCSSDELELIERE